MLLVDKRTEHLRGGLREDESDQLDDVLSCLGGRVVYVTHFTRALPKFLQCHHHPICLAWPGLGGMDRGAWRIVLIQPSETTFLSSEIPIQSALRGAKSAMSQHFAFVKQKIKK